LASLYFDEAAWRQGCDFLDKPIKDGGLALSRPLASAVIAVFIIGCLLVLPQRADQDPARADVSGVSHRQTRLGSGTSATPS
jgi:hypothetical protein